MNYNLDYLLYSALYHKAVAVIIDYFAECLRADLRFVDLLV